MQNKSFIDYYNKEIEYLRESGKSFSKKHPKIAKHLKFDDEQSPDPHVERLLESFAFLAAKINLKIDQNFARMGRTLLEILYPHLIRPIPTMMMVEFKLAENLSDFVYIPKNTQLYTYGFDEEPCYFSTTYPIKLWPITICDVNVVNGQKYQTTDVINLSQNYLCLTFLTKNLDIDEILIRIKSEQQKALDIHRLILSAQDQTILYSNDQKNAFKFKQKIIHHMGFLPDESMLPIPDYSSHIYSLFQDFFHFREKFLFFKLLGLNTIPKTDKLDILIPLTSNNYFDFASSISSSDFAVNSVPVVNLFETTTDPIKIDYTQIEYQVFADQRRKNTTEIYSIQEVYATLTDGQKQIYRPFFSLQHEVEEKSTPYWISKRIPSEMNGKASNDMFLSFVKSNFELLHPDQETIFAKILCTNCDLPTRITPKTRLYLDKKLPIQEIQCATFPRQNENFIEDGETLWKLIGQLGINHLSLDHGPYVMQTIREMIAIYSRNHNDYKIMDIIHNIEIKEIVRRFGKDPWRGFTHGISLTIYTNFESKLAFLLSYILRHFFATSIPVNSFSEGYLIDTKSGEQIMHFIPIANQYLSL